MPFFLVLWFVHVLCDEKKGGGVGICSRQVDAYQVVGNIGTVDIQVGIYST